MNRPEPTSRPGPGRPTYQGWIAPWSLVLEYLLVAAVALVIALTLYL